MNSNRNGWDSTKRFIVVPVLRLEKNKEKCKKKKDIFKV